MNRTGNEVHISAKAVPKDDAEIRWRQRERRERGNVYFITDGVAVKIGFSTFVPSRLDGLQGAHHAELRVIAQFIGSPSDEQALHQKFRHLRLRGEWFQPNPEIDAFIAELETARRLIENLQTTIRGVVRGEHRPLLLKSEISTQCQRMLGWLDKNEKDFPPELAKLAKWARMGIWVWQHNPKNQHIPNCQKHLAEDVAPFVTAHAKWKAERPQRKG